MSGTISSAQVRPIIPDAPALKIDDGTVSSHDLLREQAQAVASPAPEITPATETVETQETVAEQPTIQDTPKFRDLREKDEQIARLVRGINQNPQPAQPNQPVQYKRDPDEILQGKDLQPIIQELEEYKQKVRQFEQYTATEQMRNNLRRQLPDYDEIMTADNLKDLEYADPQIAQALKSSSDFEGASKIAYTLIKSMNIHTQDVLPQKESPRNIEYEKQKMKDNLAKPKPASAIGKSNTPLGELSPYHREQTKEHKDMIWERMQKKLRSRQG